jgi:abequosyltransferase
MLRKVEKILHGLRYLRRYLFSDYNHLGKMIAFDSGVEISHPEFTSIGDYVHMQKDVWITCVPKNSQPLIKIGDHTDIGKRLFISCAKKVEIGKGVLIAPNVFISDHSHNYQNTKIPVKNQGVTDPKPVEIGDGVWLGINVAILPGVKIGKNSVIGANSVVIKSIPDFCVAVGSPAKVVKRFHPRSKKWS